MSTAATAFTAKVFNLFTRSALLGVFLLLIFGISALAEAQTPDDPTQSEQLLATFSTDSFQTDLFTGSATAQIPIQVPSTAAGLAPKIAIRYNSGILDQLKKNQQGSGAGLGWNPDLGGFILRDMQGTTSTSDDKFKLIFGGASYDLIQIDSVNKIYHTKDESFLRVQYFSTGDYWVLTTKDGLQHRFGFNTDSKMIGLAVDLKTVITWRYFLDEVKTTSGLSIRYSYSKTTAKAKSTNKPYDQAVYLDLISYPYQNGALVGPAREVRFLRAPRTDWHDTTSSTYISLFEKERLDSVEVRVGGSLVRNYTFGFDYSIDRNPGGTWQGGATGDLTLKSVTVLGSDGLSALPSQTFTYNAAGFLATANNGLGGSVSYTYEAIKNIYLNQNEGDSACGAGRYFSDAPGTCSLGVFGYVLKDPAPNTVPLYLVQLDGGDTCGPAWLLTYTTAGACSGWEIFGYLWTTSTPDSIPIYLVTYDGDTSCSGWYLSDTTLGTCDHKVLGYARAGMVDYYRGGKPIYDHARNRVLSRTTQDGLGWSSTTNFISYNPTYGPNVDTIQEFRGFGQVRAIDPLGHYTDTFFLQDDLKQGRTSKVEVRNSTGALFSKIVNTWLTKTPFTRVTLVYLSQVDKYKCDGDPTCLQTRQTFTYDASGNPT
jgi:hypothetical protein